MDVEINVKIVAKSFGTIDFTESEAREMYEKLHEYFGVKTYVPMPAYPPWKPTWGTLGAEE